MWGDSAWSRAAKPGATTNQLQAAEQRDKRDKRDKREWIQTTSKCGPLLANNSHDIFKCFLCGYFSYEAKLCCDTRNNDIKCNQCKAVNETRDSHVNP